MKRILLNTNEINPFIQRLGIQGDEGWDYDRRLYDYALLYIITGKCRLVIDHRTYKVQSGSLLLIPPNTPTKFYIDALSDIRWIHFDFFYMGLTRDLSDADYYDIKVTQKELIRPKLYLSSGSPLPYVISFSPNSDLTPLILELFTHYYSSDSHRTLLCKSTFLQIIHHIFKYVETHEDRSITSTPMRYVYEMRFYMEQNYYNPLTLQEITNYAGISPNYANTLFKKNTGFTLIQYLNKFRIEKAVNLLASSDMKVEQIAAYVGIMDYHYFSRMVKKYTGRSPRDHR